MLWKGALAIIVSALVCAAAVAATEPKRSVKVEHFVNKKILYNDKPPVNGTILYQACDVDYNRKNAVTCEIIQQDTERKLSCPLNVADVVDEYIASYPVARDKAVVIYHMDSKAAPGTKLLKLLNVDLNSCKIREREVTVPTGLSGNNWLNLRLISLLPYEDQLYDVIFTDEVLCNGTFCKGTYDHEGNVVQELSSWNHLTVKKFGLYIASVNPNSPADGYLIIYNGRDSKIEATLFKDDHEKVLDSWEFPENKFKIPSAEVYSTNDNAIGVCVQFSLKISCTLFDSEGKAKQKALLDDEGELLYAVYNLANGFLILTQACLEPNFDDHPWHVVFCKDQKFFIRRYDSQGNLVKKVVADDFKWDKPDYAAYGNFFRNEAGEYCASLAMYMLEVVAPKPNVPQSVELATQCFTDLI